jgi:hypothetical protein
MRDFTLKTYTSLFKKLKERNYTFLTFKEYSDKSKVKNQKSKVLILRHDVDRLPENALASARIENEFDIKGTYYFRIVPESFDKNIIKQIADLGHEIGYHYEEMDSPFLISPKGGEKSLEMRIDSAYELFRINLEKIREVADIKTICMHGSPLSKYDNKLLWTKYNFRDLGIVGEPYLDINWNEFVYLTDTGRRWDGVAIRDKVKSQKLKVISNSRSLDPPSYQASSIQHPGSSIQHPASGLPHTRDGIQNPAFRSTFDIIKAIEIGKLPPKIMLTVHPERWNDDWYLWTKQFVFQNFKNLAKQVILKQRRTS